MDFADSTSLSSQLLALKTRHRSLDVEIGRLQEFAFVDQLHLQRLKKQKLRIKENIERLNDLLIPDLDA